MGVKPVDTAVAVQTPQAIGPALARWQGIVDDVVVRAITAHDTIDDHVALVRALRIGR
jgi:hypothetical protein